MCVSFTSANQLIKSSFCAYCRSYNYQVEVNDIVKCVYQPIRIAYSGVNYHLTTKSQLKSFIQLALGVLTNAPEQAMGIITEKTSDTHS